MARLYGNEIYAAQLRAVDKTLFSVLTDSEIPCLVHRNTGIDMSRVEYDLRGGSFGFKPVSEEEVRRIKSGRVAKEEFAVSYVTRFINPPRIIMDHSHNRHFNINPEEKKILVIKREFKLLFDTPTIRQYGDYIYDGTLLGALNEFKENGYEFFEAEIIDGEPVPTREVNLENLVT